VGGQDLSDFWLLPVCLSVCPLSACLSVSLHLSSQVSGWNYLKTV